MQSQLLRPRNALFGLSAIVFQIGCNQVLGLDGLRVSEDPALSGDGGADAASSDTGLDAALLEDSAAMANEAVDGGGLGADAAEPIDGTTAIAEDGGSEQKRCTSNRECSSAGAVPAPSRCRAEDGKCVPLLSEDCTLLTDRRISDPSQEPLYLNDSAIFIGSLFSTSGPQAATNLARQQSAMLAVEEINAEAVGGVPGKGSAGGGRPLVLISCDEVVNPVRAAQHLVHDVRVPAIVGPNTSQDTINLTNTLTAAAGTALLTPTGVASSIADLRDNDLTWAMAPSDEQRAPLMIRRINALEAQLAAAAGRNTPIKLGVVFRNDALGIGTRVSLNTLQLNGKGIADASNFGSAVHINGYDPKATSQADIVAEYVAFQPDIVVMAGLAEAITQIMLPMEQGWPVATPRPYYVLIDSLKVPELLTAVAANSDLRARVSGTGITPGPESKPVYDAFVVDYSSRYKGSATTISGMGASYDATYAIAYALAATTSQDVSGAAIVEGLRKLSEPRSTRIPVQNTRLLEAFQRLTRGESVTPIGTFGPLVWDARGAVSGGTLELWCIAVQGGTAATPSYQTSGATYDLATQVFSGTYKACNP